MLGFNLWAWGQTLGPRSSHRWGLWRQTVQPPATQGAMQGVVQRVGVKSGKGAVQGAVQGGLQGALQGAVLKLSRPTKR